MQILHYEQNKAFTVPGVPVLVFGLTLHEYVCGPA